MQASFVLLAAGYVLAFAAAACVPDVALALLSDPRVLKHEAVLLALNEVQRNLSALYKNTTRDGLSVAIVHASSPAPIFTFNNGTLKFNETLAWYPETQYTHSRVHRGSEGNKVTSDSIFRILSISKNIALSSSLVLANNSNVTLSHKRQVSLDTPVRLLLPAFALPERDWRDGGSEITLRMLASHTAGIPRESYSTGFNMILSTGKADAPTIGAAWAGQTAQDVIEGVKARSLMFAPGQRAAYSNAGIGLLGAAVATHYNDITGSDLTWSEFATQELLTPLNMTHSFFGAIPQNLMPDVGIPGGENWADLLVGEGYDPAAGMWSSANDLSSYLYHMWLSPDPPLISKFQQRDAMKPSINLPDGVQQTGPGWEIELLKLASSNESDGTTESPPTKTYSIFGKSGNGGGWASWIDTIPNLGYGLVILAQQSGLKDYQAVSPSQLKTTLHGILAPAFITALAERTVDRFAGHYMKAHDTGLLHDQVVTASRSTRTHARLEVEAGTLYLRSLIVNGTSALEAVDRLSWTPDAQPILFSSPQGVVLEPAEGAAETAQFGAGAQVWRMMFPELESCDWFDFDGFQDSNGWPLSKLVLVERGAGRVELHYPPFDVVISRV
ncbi:hypothetical protein ACJBU6_04103 [Exserohilum turcicum]